MLNHKIVVAGIPRCGTMYVFDNVAQYSQRIHGVPTQVVKTHGLAPPECSYDTMWQKVEKFMVEGAKVIFVFGDPVASILSTKRSQWNNFHARNCGYYEDIFKADITTHDVLGYEAIFDSWMKEHPYDVMSIRYESLPQNKGYIDYFTDCNIRWSEWIPRKTTYTTRGNGEIEQIELTYSGLIKKVKDALDCNIKVAT